jgi:ferredoxin
VSLRFSINEKCTSCMACVRVCPVEAIAVSGNQLRIDRCAYPRAITMQST